MGQLVLGNEMYACAVWVTVFARHQTHATSYMSPRAGQGNGSFIIQRNRLQWTLKTANPRAKSVLKLQFLPQSNSNGSNNWCHLDFPHRSVLLLQLAVQGQ